MKSLFSGFGGSAIVAAALLSAFLLFSATASIAETPLTQSQQSKQQPAQQTNDQDPPLRPTVDDSAKGALETPTPQVIEESTEPESVARPTVTYRATAYSLRGRTASGKFVTQGIIAADPRVLPLGTRVRLEAGSWSGEYLVADTGGAIRGRKIDIWTPTAREALRFGRRIVKLTVLNYGGKRSATKKRAQM